MLATDWETLVKDALKNFHDTDKLNQHPLADLNLVARECGLSVYLNDPHRKARALREVLRSAVATLGMEGEPAPKDPYQLSDPKWMEPNWRSFSILTLMPHYDTQGIAGAIGLAAGGQYYREQSKAVRLLAEVLREWEGYPTEDASPIPLVYPGGAVKLSDRFYVERGVDLELGKALSVPGATVTIRGSRQVGKTSLLIRGVNHAQRRQGARAVYFDLQEAGEEPVESLDRFLKAMAGWIVDDLGLDYKMVEEGWNSSLPATRKLTNLIERRVLTETNVPIVLAMDEIDRLLLTPFHAVFFGLVRSWHNKRASRSIWDKLNILMAISTEPYLLIADLNQSPFNVGEELFLGDFGLKEVAELNIRYGAPLSEGEILESMVLLNGQPYLTRVAFYTMVANAQSWNAFRKAAISDSGPYRQHLQRLYRLLLNEPVLKKAMSEILHEGVCSDDRSGFRLIKAGLARQEGDKYFSRCDLYQQYFVDKL